MLKVMLIFNVLVWGIVLVIRGKIKVVWLGF